IAAAALVLGLLPYLYLPLRAAQHPPLNWGDPETLQGFLTVVTRRGYGTFSLSALGGGSASFHLAAYARSLFLKHFPVPLALLGVVGIVACWRKRPAEVALAVL